MSIILDPNGSQQPEQTPVAPDAQINMLSNDGPTMQDVFAEIFKQLEAFQTFGLQTKNYIIQQQEHLNKVNLENQSLKNQVSTLETRVSDLENRIIDPKKPIII